MQIFYVKTALAALPGTVLPGQIERQFQKPPEFRATQPGEIPSPAVEQATPANASEIRFTLSRLSIEGTKSYTEEALLQPYKKLNGTEVSLSDIYRIASELTTRYRNDGFILSKVVVPTQSIESGIVRLQAIEGYVSDIIIEGDKLDSRGLVQKYADQIKNIRPLTASVLERYMLLINDLPGAFAQATIRSSKNEPGASELVIHFAQAKTQGGLSVDNRDGRALGPMRYMGNLSLNSVLGLQENTSIRYVDSGNEELSYLAITHEELIGSEGGKISLFLSRVRSTPDEVSFITLNQATDSETGSLTYNYPLLRSRAENIYLRGSLYSFDGKTKIFGTQLSNDRIRAVRLGASFDLADRYHGLNLLDVEVSQGLKGLGASSNDDPSLSRIYGNVNFSKLTLYAARLQALSGHWSLLGAFNGQYAFTDLLSSELFGFGGDQFGRGYDPSEIVGDNGLAAKLELRYSGSLPTSFSSSWTGYGFYDVGKVYQRTPAGQPPQESAASAGLGVRFSVGQHYSGFIEVAKPLTRDVAAEQDRNARGYAGLSVQF